MNIFSKIALKTIWKNRTRTVVTIIGIILSASMFTAVTTAVSSFTNYYRDYTVYTHGNWDVVFYDLTEDELEELSGDSQIGELNYLQLLGFARLADSKNANKPYLCVNGVNKDAYDLLPIRLTGGRMPEDSNEILIPDHLKSNGGVAYELGDVLKLEIGTRVKEGVGLDNHTGYYEEEAESETLENTTERSYTVVGFYMRPDFEDYSAPGYTAITIADDLIGFDNYTYEVYFRTQNERNAADYYEKNITRYSSGGMNWDYLRVYGISGESNYNSTLYGFAAILIGIILFGSVALIYNSFSISVSERTRLFGVLSSIGATKKQLVRSVLTEGIFLGCIGVPLGILAGIIGMGITFYAIGENLSQMFFGDYPEKFTMQISLPAILIAVVIAFFTILISAYMPVRKALKRSAIETIRQGGEIKLKSRQVKTSRLTKLLFGFEGMLASKNFKRNRKKYRATVVSLFVSVVLFISASSFCAYLEKSVGTVYESSDYDMVAQVMLGADGQETADSVREILQKQSGVTRVHYSTKGSSHLALDKAEVSKEAEKFIAYFQNVEEIPDKVYLDSFLVFMDDEDFESYARDMGADPEDYFDPEAPKALVYDEMKYYGEDDRYHLAETFSNRKQISFTLALTPAKENLEYYGIWTEDGVFQNVYGNPDTGEEVMFPAAESCKTFTLSGKLVSKLPDSVANVSAFYRVILIFPYSQVETLYTEMGSGYENTRIDPASLYYTINTEDHTATAAELKSSLDTLEGVDSFYIDDYVAQLQEERTMVFIIDVFSYGFIILISLIALANVFNTISTNIQLRSREFAMLRSVGMTPKGMYRMMNYECLLYGIKGLLYGLPVSIAITWLIYRSALSGMEMRFFIPWYSLVIAVGSVFIVVFATMLYSMRKLQKENTMDALKNENI